MRKETKALLKQLISNQEMIMKHLKIRPAAISKQSPKKNNLNSRTGNAKSGSKHSK
jgi:hypothetical protein